MLRSGFRCFKGEVPKGTTTLSSAANEIYSAKEPHNESSSFSKFRVSLFNRDDCSNQKYVERTLPNIPEKSKFSFVVGGKTSGSNKGLNENCRMSKISSSTSS